VDEKLAKAMVKDPLTTAWLVRLIMRRRGAWAGSAVRYFCVYLWEERKLLHLDDEFDLAQIQEAAQAVIDRHGSLGRAAKEANGMVVIVPGKSTGDGGLENSRNGSEAALPPGVFSAGVRLDQRMKA
jgi:hypothetical protein